MSNSYFITGISTDVGKTVVAAILTEALMADYWKPIQAGELENSDTHKVKRWISNPKTVFHPSAFELKTPMSPHAAADIDGVKISVKSIKRPKSNNDLVIESAGGLLVPLNDTETVADLIKTTDRVIVVSQHYLGSINHTLLTIQALKLKKSQVFGIIFNGLENKTTEDIIAKMSGVPILGRIDQEPFIDSNVIKEYADKFTSELTRKR